MKKLIGLIVCFVPIVCYAQYPQIMWSYDLNAPSFGSAAVGDLKNNGKLEIVFGTYFNDENIYVLNADSGTLVWKYNTGSCNDASPAIADVDGDSNLEVVEPASSGCKVYCFNGKTGEVKWSTPTGHCIDSPPAIADLYNDGKMEIVFGTFEGCVFCLNGKDGSVKWSRCLDEADSTSYIQSEPDLLDLNNDGKLDVVVAQFEGDDKVYALNGIDGTTLWSYGVPDMMYHGGSFADIDEGGKPEIAIGCYDGHIYTLNGEDGSLLWSYAAPYYVGAPTSIADLNNDNHKEIVFTSYNEVGALSKDGDLLWSYSAGGDIFRGVSIADIDSNGILDVVFGSYDGMLTALQGDSGKVIWTYDLQADYGKTFQIDNAPVIADFDGDGKLDVFIVGGYGCSDSMSKNQGRAYALKAGNGTGPGWSMFRHDLRHSGCFEGPWNGVEEQLPVSSKQLAVNAEPNPFTTVTNIKWSVTSGQKTDKIKIYDLSGKLIEETKDNIIGKNLKTGVYFVKVNDNKKLLKIIKIGQIK